MPDFLRYPDFHIHGAAHTFLAWLSHPLTADVEMALASNVLCGKCWDRRQRNRYFGIVGACCEPAGYTGNDYCNKYCDRYSRVHQNILSSEFQLGLTTDVFALRPRVATLLLITVSVQSVSMIASRSGS